MGNLMEFNNINCSDATVLPKEREPMIHSQDDMVGPVYAAHIPDNSKMESQLKDLFERDADGNTALMRALLKADKAAITGMFQGISLKTRLSALSLSMNTDEGGEQEILTMIASGDCSFRIISTIFEGLSEDDRLKLLTWRNKNGDTPLMLAARRGFGIRSFRKELSEDNYMRALSERNADGETALMIAVRVDDSDAICALLEGLSQENHLKALAELKSDGKNVLTGAYPYHCHPKIIKALSQGLLPESNAKALVQLDGQGNSLLECLVASNNAEGIRMLFEGFSEEVLMAILDQPINDQGSNALITASSNGCKEAFVALLERLPKHKQQLAVTRRGYDKASHFTPLDACLSGAYNEDIMELLLSLGAPCITDNPLPTLAKNHLSHLRFGLNGKPKETIPVHVIYQSLSHSLYRFNQQNGGDPSLADVEAAFLNTTAYQFLTARTIAERIIRGESVVIPTGWDKHSTAVVFANGLVMKCNRGDLSNDSNCGVEVFEPSSPLSLDDVDKLAKAIKMLRMKRAPDDFYQNLDTILDLKRVPLNEHQESFVHRKEQESGNCMVKSARAAVIALLFAKFRDSPKGLAHAAILYKKFKAIDCANDLNENPEWAKTHPEAFLKTRRAEKKVTHKPQRVACIPFQCIPVT